MKFLFFRLIPWATAVLGFLAAEWQWGNELLYPWPLVAFCAWVVAAILILGWKRLAWLDILEKMLPTVFTLALVVFGFLVAESTGERAMRTWLLTLIPLISLELFFLAAFDPARYPVNGLSRLNLALVPLAAFFLASTMNGLFVFVRIPWYLAPLLFTIFGAFFYYVTAHPTASKAHRRRWGWIGGFIGLHAGVLGLLMPVAMVVHGAFAALLMAFPLRIRRYAYQPVPTQKIAWTEGVIALLAFMTLLLVSRWA